MPRRGAVSGGGGFVNIDYSGVTRLQRAFQELPAATRRTLRAAMVEAAGEFVDEWRSNLAYSSWQGGALEVSGSISAAQLIQVRLNAKKAPSPDHEPLPRLEEFGNPFFRHMVFGHADRWVSQKGHPAMVPAIKKSEPVVREKATEAVAAAARSVGLSLT